MHILQSCCCFSPYWHFLGLKCADAWFSPHTLGNTGEVQPLTLSSFWPHLSFSCFIWSSTFDLVWLCPRPVILLVRSSGIISSQLQEGSTSCSPTHHQANYLCDSPEQHRVHTRCLPRGQAPARRTVDHGQPWSSHLQLDGQLGQHQSGHDGHGVGSGKESSSSGEPHLRSDMW